MKKMLLAVLISGCLIFSLATAGLASSVYLDGLVGGAWNYEDDTTDSDDDLSAYVIGLDLPVNQFKINFEYLSGTAENANSGNDLDYTSFELKGGYRLLEQKDGNLYATLGYYQQAQDDNADTTFGGFVIGVDGRYSFNENMKLDGSLGFSINGNWEADGAEDEDADLFTAKVKFTYLFAKNYGVSLGYRYYKITTDASGDPEYRDAGPTLGFSYNF